MEPYNRKKIGSSASKPQRGASLNRVSPKDNDNQTNGFSFFPVNNKTLFPSPKNATIKNVKTTKAVEAPRKKVEAQSTFDIFTERYQQLQLHSILPHYEPSRSSQKPYGLVKAFGVCTNQGLVRDYNEDRVSIVLDIPKPFSKTDVENWPSASIFGVFDGHGGSKCADFLRNNLHYYIAHNKHFPTNPEEAIKEACEAAERRFIETQLAGDEKPDNSGSCGLVMVIVGDTCYIGNVGDSRAVVSRNGGKFKQAITRDHKPNDELERVRILNAGGRIYQNFPSMPANSRLGSTIAPVASGPHRILPGGLAVSRAFGDLEAKVPKYGGNSNVLIAKPEITTLKINRAVDFIVLGSDGIFDNLSNEDVIKSVWDTIEKEDTSDVHELLRVASENLIKESLLKRSYDNVTVIIVAFPSLLQKLNPSTNTLESISESNNEFTLSPRVPSPKNTEESVPEAVGKENNSPPQGNGLERTARAERISPAKMNGVILNRASSQRKDLRKDIRTPKSKDGGRREPEILPKIVHKGSGGRQM